MHRVDQHRVHASTLLPANSWFRLLKHYNCLRHSSFAIMSNPNPSEKKRRQGARLLPGAGRRRRHEGCSMHINTHTHYCS